MTKWLLLVMALAGCGKSDKCGAMYDKLAPGMKEELKGAPLPDREKMVAQCKETLKTKPEAEKPIDCLLAISGTPTRDQIAECEEAGGLSRKPRKGSADLELNRLGKHAKLVFGETGSFPIGKVGPTPAAECCGQKDKDGKQVNLCQPAPEEWKVEPWKTLDYSIDEQSTYRYTYESTDGKSFTATAVGDADCDTQHATITLTGTVENGAPKTSINPPPKGIY